MKSPSPETMANPVLTEDTLRAMEELLGKVTPGTLDAMPNGEYEITIAGGSTVLTDHDCESKLLFALRNNAVELLRGYRLGIALDKDRK